MWTAFKFKRYRHKSGRGKLVLRGQSDKYLASPPDGVTIAREIYYRVVHSRRWLLSKFHPNRTRSFVLTACGTCPRILEKWRKSNFGL